ncbi:carboxyphosphonoenolpyruvate phosphonomutase [Emericellopsis cladophorae]|uniref:Carboxyphosphonoenolpyruvate phosphonomutase n=1 Tax=Emericellopsis cladophorae TaxID=2686198 RepID=A0A9Q0BHF4_9HYPO|nr:carboxyphosphonoenolpyruvate phosphonomutase [Emericellopsis cladophorae]KAI6785016.1 carboxyphosphonoenolpyruvate phosphonomutase [Emericellopsis cladophorae]
MSKLAQVLGALHKPSQPLILPNIYYLPSLYAILSLNTSTSQPVKAIATASWGIAATLGIADEDLTAEQNLAFIERIATTVKEAGLPLSADLQDGYGERVGEIVTKAVRLGVHGGNIENARPGRGRDQRIQGALYPVEEQVERLQTALKAASDAGCPDFMLNARTDVFLLEGLSDDVKMQEAVRRGKAYLAAGATTVFVWGGARGLRDGEVKTLAREFEGRLAVKLAMVQEALSTTQVANLGVARISIGPSLYHIAMDAMKKSAVDILQGNRLVL